MTKTIHGVVIVNYGVIIGELYLGENGKPSEIINPRVVQRAIDNQTGAPGKITVAKIMCNPKSILDPQYCTYFEVQDEDLLAEYFRSTTGLHLAPKGNGGLIV